MQTFDSDEDTADHQHSIVVSPVQSGSSRLVPYQVSVIGDVALPRVGDKVNLVQTPGGQEYATGVVYRRDNDSDVEPAYTAGERRVGNALNDANVFLDEDGNATLEAVDTGHATLKSFGGRLELDNFGDLYAEDQSGSMLRLWNDDNGHVPHEQVEDDPNTVKDDENETITGKWTFDEDILVSLSGSKDARIWDSGDEHIPFTSVEEHPEETHADRAETIAATWKFDYNIHVTDGANTLKLWDTSESHVPYTSVQEHPNEAHTNRDENVSGSWRFEDNTYADDSHFYIMEDSGTSSNHWLRFGQDGNNDWGISRSYNDGPLTVFDYDSYNVAMEIQPSGDIDLNKNLDLQDNKIVGAEILRFEADPSQSMQYDSSAGKLKFYDMGNGGVSYLAGGGIEHLFRASANPASTGEIFRIESAGGAVRLGVEHDGKVYTENDYIRVGTGDNNYGSVRIGEQGAKIEKRNDDLYAVDDNGNAYNLTN